MRIESVKIRNFRGFVDEAMGSKFPKLPYHSIACIGALIVPSVCMGETEALVPRRQA